jgi:hypothetical protein
VTVFTGPLPSNEYASHCVKEAMLNYALLYHRWLHIKIFRSVDILKYSYSCANGMFSLLQIVVEVKLDAFVNSLLHGEERSDSRL